MQIQDLIHAGGGIHPYHGAGVDHAISCRLHSAVAMWKKIKLYSAGGAAFVIVCLQANPMSFGVAILCRLRTEDRPAAGGVDHGLNGKFTAIGLHLKRSAALD